ncbi:alpha/beta hydrolase-fold protein, partial [Acidobacteria bacterium AH-259-D05]|nr:alpha/beta hydrolase-fold protein [Acidobacteria bacterium AH-259-D05]
TRFVVLLTVAICFSAICTWGQRWPSRRIQNPETIYLEGGSRVEFREFSSAALGENVQYSIFLPPAYDQESDRRFPVIYVLHGMNNDHTTWTSRRYGNIPLLVENLLINGDTPQFLMVHPYGENPFYTDFVDGTGNYEEYVYKDLREEIEKTFRVKTDRLNRALAGTSLGGYGALKIAMKHPELYSSVAAGSPIILLGDDPSPQILTSSARAVRIFAGLFRPVFGTPFNQAHWIANSVEVLVRTGDLKDLNIHLSYGTADRYQNYFPLEQGIQAIDQTLTERGIPHVFRAYQGDPHGWLLIKNHIQEIVEFVTQTFSADN